MRFQMILSTLLSRTSYRNPFPITILRELALIHRRERLDLYYAGRSVAQLTCCVFGRVINGIPTPFLAYVDQFEIAHFREATIKNPSWNLPVRRLRKATLARLKPTDIDQDPYLASILIALAQVRQYTCSNDTAARLSSHKVRLYLRVSSLQEFANQEAGPSPRH
jgi:hypothetical protein